MCSCAQLGVRSSVAGRRMMDFQLFVARLSLGGLSGVYRVVSQIGRPYARVKPSCRVKMGETFMRCMKV